MLNKHSIKVIGHRNPDTDSVCAAIAYSRLKNILDPAHPCKPCRAGALSRETEFALQYFHVPAPELYTSVSPQIRDIDIRQMPGISGDTSLRKAWMMMRDQKIETLCIVEENQLKGMITMQDIAVANLDKPNPHILAAAKTSYQNLVGTLHAEVVVGDITGKVIEGNIVIGTNGPEVMENAISKGDVVILGNRVEGQLSAIEQDAGCIVVCTGARVSRAISLLAEEKGCIVLRTPLDSYVAGQITPQAAPVSHFMVTEGLLTFTLDSKVSDATKIIASVRHHYFPVLDADGAYLGVISRRNLMNLHKKQVILVDHNEKSQAVEGLEDAEVLEIIDHHRINALETDSPVYFRNVPVGCTCTIIYTMYRENRIDIEPDIAGLMLSAILSDTLMFRSPTCTSIDQQAAQELAKIAGVDLEEYADAMFEAGADVSGKTPEEIFYTDYKVFSSGDIRFGVGQISFLSGRGLKACESVVGPYLETALREQKLDYVFYMFTNVRTADTELLLAGKGAQQVAEEAFHTAMEGDRILLPGVVSRKKQVIPAMLSTIKAMTSRKKPA